MKAPVLMVIPAEERNCDRIPDALLCRHPRTPLEAQDHQAQSVVETFPDCLDGDTPRGSLRADAVGRAIGCGAGVPVRSGGHS